MQSKAHSLIESVSNIALGYGVALLSQVIIFPVFDIHTSFTNNLKIGLWFTGISLVRSYAIRRFFTKKTERSCPMSQDN